MADTFPRQQARTRGFTLGAPRTFTIPAGGRRVLFLRSAAGDDPLTALWVLDLDSGEERLVADPRSLDSASPFPGKAPGEAGSDPVAERARRERSREKAEGIVAYSIDREARRACFAVAGKLWLADVSSGGCRPLETAGPVFDPRLNPAGEAIAYCSGSDLRLLRLDPEGAAAGDDLLAGEAGPDVTWGQAEFVAAEEMDRSRGYWWSPDGQSLLAARVDESPVNVWWISDPAHPERPPAAHRYPAAGTADAGVTLHRVGLGGEIEEVTWDRSRFPYLVDVTWSGTGPALVVVESRDHRRSQVLQVDGQATRVLVDERDDAWVSRLAGTPAWLEDGRLVWSRPSGDRLRILVAGEAVTPPDLEVRRVLDVGEAVTFAASSDPTETELWRWSTQGLERLTSGGVASGAARGSIVAVAAHRLDGPPHYFAIGPGGARHPIGSLAEQPLVEPRVRILEVGERRLRTAVLLPDGHRPGERLPVVMSPYAGPGFQRVVAARSAWLEAQWLANQGFAVVVADGRGTPGRGPQWERTVAGDLATAALEDQVSALLAAAELVPELDVARGVGIRGWSFGGYLAALAVLRRPDVFTVAVAGAPVTDWRLYDTYYTERFLGHPDEHPDAYRRSSLLEDAATLRRPLMLIHGLADDNVVVAHSLLLSRALMEAGRPHTLLPLTGVTHMASQEEVAENLLKLQVEFLSRHLGTAA